MFNGNWLVIYKSLFFIITYKYENIVINYCLLSIRVIIIMVTGMSCPFQDPFFAHRGFHCSPKALMGFGDHIQQGRIQDFGKGGSG